MDAIIPFILIALFILIAWVPGWILTTPELCEEFPTARDKLAGVMWLGFYA
jgi:hypothetical protein